MFVVKNKGKTPGFVTILNSENQQLYSIYPFFDSEGDELIENETSPLQVNHSLKSPTKAFPHACFNVTHTEAIQQYKVFLTKEDVGLWKMKTQKISQSMRSLSNDASKIQPITGNSQDIWVKTKKK